MNIKTPIEILAEECGFDAISKYSYVVDKDCALEAIESYHSQFEDKWIDVKTELPKPNRWVSVYVPSRLMSFMAIWKDSGFGMSWHSPFDEIHEGITHWKSLPSNPK